MAFARNDAAVNYSNSDTKFHRYCGIGGFKVVAINPTSAEIAALYPNRKVIPNPEYIIPDKDGRDGGKRALRIDIYLQLTSVPKGTQAEGLEISPEGNVTNGPIEKASFLLGENTVYNQDKTKVQIIDAYGDTTWLNLDESGKPFIKEGEIVNISTRGRRPAFVGEERLTNFVKAWVNVGRRGYIKRDDSGNLMYHVLVPDTDTKGLDSCTAQFETIANWFDGSLSELQNLAKAFKSYEVKMLLGVRKVGDKQYADFYLDAPMKMSVFSYDHVARKLEDSKSRGRYSESDFGKAPFPFMVYTPEPTNTQSIVSAPIGAVPRIIGLGSDYNTVEEEPFTY